MDRVWIRSAAIGAAFACGTMVAGPGVVGLAQSHAILGIGPDLLDLLGGHDDKSDIHHPRPGSEDASSGQAARTVGVTTADAGPPVSTFGSGPESAGLVADGGAVPRSAPRGGGGGAVPRVRPAGRSSNLPSVPSAPITRNIVIRGTPSTAPPAVAVPAFASPRMPQAPAVVALAAPPPVVPEPEGRPAPAAPPAPSPVAPPAEEPLAPSDSGTARVPDSYRVGYAQYLRSATTSDLFEAALPGMAGIAGFTLVGAYAGYRQAKALQRALLAPVPTSFLL